MSPIDESDAAEVLRKELIFFRVLIIYRLISMSRTSPSFQKTTGHKLTFNDLISCLGDTKLHWN